MAALGHRMNQMMMHPVHGVMQMKVNPTHQQRWWLSSQSVRTGLFWPLCLCFYAEGLSKSLKPCMSKSLDSCMSKSLKPYMSKSPMHEQESSYMREQELNHVWLMKAPTSCHQLHRSFLPAENQNVLESIWTSTGLCLNLDGATASCQYYTRVLLYKYILIVL